MTSSSQAKHMALGQLYTNEITDPRILQAMVDVPREHFVPAPLKGVAYVDEELPIGQGRFLMEPLTAAKLLLLSGISETNRVLVVGAVTGYVVALAAKIAHHVVATETDSQMLEVAKQNLSKLNLGNVDFQHVRSLADGYALSAPYDVIIITGAVEVIPESLGSQLSIHGKLTAVFKVAGRPASGLGLGRGTVVTRAAGGLQFREVFDASSALLPEFAKPAGFSF
ncbi:MAG: protein-L-isoaspartate O-methyltransferase [Rickettsiales bacterium]|jgi:protein-L-isoaspartate(D-aspartate) O-methyltransferase|nr:protein-L-isoaspartate O-methyltransferase [Rickettsiales bacterium]